MVSGFSTPVRDAGGATNVWQVMDTGDTPTADSLGVDDAIGGTGTYVVVPVKAVNVTNGPVQGFRLGVGYNESVLSLTSISTGNLTSTWERLQLGDDGHTMIIATAYTAEALPDGSTGSVVLLNFSVLGSAGDISPVNMIITELSDSDGNVGTAPAKNGTIEVCAGPTANSLGVDDATGGSGTYVVVPVNVVNVMNGPVQGFRLGVGYNESVLTLTSISTGNLTSTWERLLLGADKHTMIIATADTAEALPDGSTGSVLLLNFSVLGSAGDISPMNMTFIELSDPDGNVGTAPAKNGTFEVAALGTIDGWISYTCNGTGISDATVNLKDAGGIVINTITTNETGYYSFTDLNPGSYFVNVSKLRFWANSTEVSVTAGVTTHADMTLCLKGDLNVNCSIADEDDVELMLAASVGQITGDMRYDLNENGNIADIGDVVLILKASVGDIELL